MLFSEMSYLVLIWILFFFQVDTDPGTSITCIPHSGSVVIVRRADNMTLSICEAEVYAYVSGKVMLMITLILIL